MMNKRRTGVLLGVAGLVLAVHCSEARQAVAAAAAPPAAAYEPFPSGLAGYEVRLFELVDPGEGRYDAGVARQLRELVANQLARDSAFLRRLTSGPAAPRRYLAAGDRSYVHYGICQAHQCDNTTLDVLFDPVRRRLVGKLLDACRSQWLGRPDSAEMALLERMHLASHPATAGTCDRRN